MGGKAQDAWPAVAPELVKIDKLSPNARNSRTHSAQQIEEIARLMLEYGWTTSVLRDEADEIIAGHGRVQAAELLVSRGHERFKVAPVITARGWSDAQKRAYVIADNQVALNAGWDQKLLGSELRDLSAAGFDMGMLAFSQTDLRRLMRGAGGGLTDPDATPAVEPVVVTELGDVWLLGEHRIRCGSSTDAADVTALLSGQVPDLMVTDPPYGVKYDPNWRSQATGQKVRATGLVLNDDRADWREAWALFPGSVCYVWHGALHSGTVQASLELEGFQMRAQIIWAKDRFALSRGHYHWRHEPAWYAVRKGRSAKWRGGRKKDTVWRVKDLEADPERLAVVQEIIEENGVQDTVWEIPMTVDDGSTGHGTQKPVECMRRPILNNSSPGQAVFEPFMGSGTTLIAAETTGRVCFGIELNPAYVDVAIERWQQFTGANAVLVETGETFAFFLFSANAFFLFFK